MGDNVSHKWILQIRKKLETINMEDVLDTLDHNVIAVIIDRSEGTESLSDNDNEPV